MMLQIHKTTADKAKEAYISAIYASFIGTSVHNDSPANPHEIKVFWQQANTFH